MYEKELEAMIKAAKDAQVEILKVYAGDFDVEIKEDDSPVTLADKKADVMIRKELEVKFPDYGFLTEESVDTKERLHKSRIFIVDPVDGTKEFVGRNGEFTTNIALCVDHEIVAGVINLPAKDTYYYALKGFGAYKVEGHGAPEKLHVSDRDNDLRVFLSRSHLRQEEIDLLDKHNDRIAFRKAVGASLKFCYIAEGKGDISVRLSPYTKEWDIAPGDILVREAGGDLLKPDGTRYSYNREDPYNHEGYMVLNKSSNLLK